MTMKESGPLEGKQVQVFITEVCDRLNCTACPLIGKSPEEIQNLRSGEINTESWVKTNDYLYQQGIRLFNIMGGEPASRPDVSEIISGITKFPDAFVMISTSGLHLSEDSEKRRKVGEALSSIPDNRVGNAIAISFDTIPPEKPKDSRELKAAKGMEFVQIMQDEFPKINFIANVMVTPSNLSNILAIQDFLGEHNVYANFCTQQSKCFGKEPVFGQNDISNLNEVAVELINKKMNGEKIVPSVSYLSQLPGIVGLEQYKCSQRSDGLSVLDIDSKGNLDFCFWLKQRYPQNKSFGILSSFLTGETKWDVFFELWKKATENCECSWSREDRMFGMTPLNETFLTSNGISIPNKNALEHQNFWVQAMGSVNSKRTDL